MSALACTPLERIFFVIVEGFFLQQLKAHLRVWEIMLSRSKEIKARA